MNFSDALQGFLVKHLGIDPGIEQVHTRLSCNVKIAVKRTRASVVGWARLLTWKVATWHGSRVIVSLERVERVQARQRHDHTGSIPLYILTSEDAIIHPHVPLLPRRDGELYYFSMELIGFVDQYGVPYRDDRDGALSQQIPFNNSAVNVLVMMAGNKKMVEYLGTYYLFKTKTAITRDDWHNCGPKLQQRAANAIMRRGQLDFSGIAGLHNFITGRRTDFLPNMEGLFLRFVGWDDKLVRSLKKKNRRNNVFYSKYFNPQHAFPSLAVYHSAVVTTFFLLSPLSFLCCASSCYYYLVFFKAYNKYRSEVEACYRELMHESFGSAKGIDGLTQGSGLATFVWARNLDFISQSLA